MRTCHLLACAASVLLNACASQAVVTSSASFWPFKQLQIQTAAGAVIGYYTRPEVPPRRLVVILQAPPCDDGSQGAVAFNTSGVLWEQFKSDSAFFQFERPGIRRAAADSSRAPAGDCSASLRDGFTRAAWKRTAGEAVAALRASEKLAGVESVYIGIADGAPVAAELAADDRRAAALVLVSGGGLNHRYERLIAALRGEGRTVQDVNDDINDHTSRASFEERLTDSIARAPHLPVLILHGALDRRIPVESALALFTELATEGRPVSMLMPGQVGRDLGLSERKLDCFEAVMRALGERMRELEAQAGTPSAKLEEIHCGADEP